MPFPPDRLCFDVVRELFHMWDSQFDWRCKGVRMAPVCWKNPKKYMITHYYFGSEQSCMDFSFKFSLSASVWRTGIWAHRGCGVQVLDLGSWSAPAEHLLTSFIKWSPGRGARMFWQERGPILELRTLTKRALRRSHPKQTLFLHYSFTQSKPWAPVNSASLQTCISSVTWNSYWKL